MNHKNHLSKIIFLGFGLFGLRSNALLADKQQLKGSLPQRVSQEREDYQECLAAVIKKYKTAKTEKLEKKRQVSLAACKDRYPAASILVDCKKQMTAGYKDQPELLKTAIKSCTSEYKKYSFDPKAIVPFTLKEDRVFFAGVGMNEATLMKESEEDETENALYMGENFGNFSCAPLYGAMFDNDPAEYTLFGTDPLLFNPLKNVTREAFLKGINYPLAKKPRSFLSKDFGEISYDAKADSYLSYLPSSYCFFDRKIGATFEALKVYFLLDRESKTVIPYFGVGFYQVKTSAQSKVLAEEIRQKLGDKYQTSELKPGVFIVATHNKFEVDNEGDPKNLCQKNAISPYVSLVVTREGSNMAAYSLLANTANLCRFGDRIASRFLKKKPM